MCFLTLSWSQMMSTLPVFSERPSTMIDVGQPCLAKTSSFRKLVTVRSLAFLIALASGHSDTSSRATTRYLCSPTPFGMWTTSTRTRCHIVDVRFGWSSCSTRILIPLWHSSHDLMYSSASRYPFFYQYLSMTFLTVPSLPRWPDSS